MLFIIVMDTLNRLFVKAQNDEVLQPIGVPAIRHHCSLYADDAILLLSPCVDEARAVKFILQLFGDASGLVTNVDKCSITPIYGEQAAIQAFHVVLPCQVLEFPIKYLGVPLSTMALPKSQYRPLIDKIGAKLPAWQGKLLNRSGRLVLVKSTLSALPIYLMMLDKLPSWVIHEIDSLRRNFLWSGGLSIAAIKDYVRLWHTLAWITLNDEPDCFRWKWTSSGTYTASSAYRAMFIGTVRTPATHWVWKSWAPLRVKFFTWLALKQRLWTADRRRRHNLDAHDTCWLCDKEAETADHMLISCSFAKVIWWNILSWMDYACSFQGQPPIHTWWEYLRGL